MISLVIPNWFFLVKPLCNAYFIEYHKEIVLPAIISIITGFVNYIDDVVQRLVLGVVMIVGLLNF